MKPWILNLPRDEGQDRKHHLNVPLVNLNELFYIVANSHRKQIILCAVCAARNCRPLLKGPFPLPFVLSHLQTFPRLSEDFEHLPFLSFPWKFPKIKLIPTYHFIHHFVFTGAVSIFQTIIIPAFSGIRWRPLCLLINISWILSRACELSCSQNSQQIVHPLQENPHRGETVIFTISPVNHLKQPNAFQCALMCSLKISRCERWRIWYPENRGSWKILAWSRNLSSVSTRPRRLIFFSGLVQKPLESWARMFEQESRHLGDRLGFYHSPPLKFKAPCMRPPWRSTLWLVVTISTHKFPDESIVTATISQLVQLSVDTKFFIFRLCLVFLWIFLNCWFHNITFFNSVVWIQYAYQCSNNPIYK